MSTKDKFLFVCCCCILGCVWWLLLWYANSVSEERKHTERKMIVFCKDRDMEYAVVGRTAVCKRSDYMMIIIEWDETTQQVRPIDDKSQR